MYERHGMSYTKIYGVWHGMLQRCENPNNIAFKNYGARGIKVCDEWHTFINFNEWAKNSGYQEDLTIDRIDTNGDYEPSNCRWVNRYIQNSNTRRNHYIEFNGKRQTISQWAREIGIERNSLIERLKNHSVEVALSAKGNMRGKKL